MNFKAVRSQRLPILSDNVSFPLIFIGQFMGPLGPVQYPADRNSEKVLERFRTLPHLHLRDSGAFDRWMFDLKFLLGTVWYLDSLVLSHFI